MLCSHSLRNCLAAVALCLLISGPSTAAREAPLPEQFQSIKEFLLESVSESQRLGAATTHSLLRENLNAFRSLKRRVDSASHIDAIINELSNELDTIATNFAKAARLRQDYSSYSKEIDRGLHRKQEQTRLAIQEIDRRISITQSELNTAANTTISDPARSRITIGANTSVLKSLHAQKEIWQRFEQTQRRLISTLNISTEKVDFVLFVLEKNAQVYREASNTAQLRRSVRMALNNLQALGAIETSLADLEASWFEVNQIVSEIGREEFGYAGS